MSTKAEREAIASLLMENVKNNDIAKIEASMTHFSEDSQWREIVRFEFSIPVLLENTLLYDVVIPRLMSYEISTLSPFHYAAYKGHNDILVNFIDHDVSVDVSLASGTSAVHLAAFGGQCDCLTMLVEVYKADINKQDRYGWSALHYAATEGHLDAIRTLLSLGINSSLRDQDGTSAAFRAEINGFQDITDLLCEEEDDLLNISPAYESRAPLPAGEPLYSSIAPKRSQSLTSTEQAKKFGEQSILREKSSKSVRRAASEIVTSKSKRSATLPRNFMLDKKTTIRRIIRKELAAAMVTDSDEAGYMSPNSSSQQEEEDQLDKFALAGVGVNTLKGIMREELSKMTKEMFERSQSVDNPPPHSPPSIHNDYEDIYETVKPVLPHVEEETDELEILDLPPPPLPPRNLDIPREIKVVHDSNGVVPKPDNFVFQRSSIVRSTGSMALKESIRKIGPVLGTDWKNLAYALPLEQTPQRVRDRVVAIEKRHPTDINKQAAMALAEWQINQRNRADIDDLVIALRKCKLDRLIDEVERVSSEFTA